MTECCVASKTLNHSIILSCNIVTGFPLPSVDSIMVLIYWWYITSKSQTTQDKHQHKVCQKSDKQTMLQSAFGYFTDVFHYVDWSSRYWREPWSTTLLYIRRSLCWSLPIFPDNASYSTVSNIMLHTMGHAEPLKQWSVRGNSKGYCQAFVNWMGHCSEEKPCSGMGRRERAYCWKMERP